MNKPLLKDPKFYTEDPLVFLLCDAYKTGHINQQPLGTDSFFENLTARSHTYFNTPLDFDGSVFMGLQRLVLRWLVGSFDNFFKTPFNQVEAEYLEYMDGVLGKGVVKSAHLKELHELGYIPLEIRAVPEGSLVPIRVPFLTIENTVDGFGWLTGYFEDLWSNELWKPCVLATKALHFRRVLEQYANETGAAQAFIDYQAHNFALRGMSGMFDDANSSVGQLIYFKGSDSFPSVWTANRFYNPGGDVSVSEIANSVPACYDSETKILTQYGFKFFVDLTENDLVAQYHEDGSVDFVKPTEYYNMPYSGKMVSFKDQFDKVDILVTPNHRMIARGSEGKIKIFEAGDTSYQNRKGYSYKRDLIVSGNVKGIRGLSAEDRLRIAFQADGSLPNRPDSYKNGQMRFSLKRQRKIIRLLSILKETGFQYSLSNVDARGYVSFWINPNDPTFLKDKDFSWVDLSKMSGQEAVEFIEELEFWDGTRKHNTIIYSSTNLLAIEKVSAIVAIAGKRSNFGSYIDKREDCKRKEIYTLSICNRNTFCGVSIERDFIDYEGTVHCVSVPTKMLIVSRNNKVCVSGNTEHSVTCLNIAVYAEELKTTPEYANVTEAELLSKAEELFQRRLITEVYPSGIFSFVSDTNDFFDTITTKAIANKDAIMARDGKLVYRPDSGNPYHILCGYTWDGDNHDSQEMVVLGGASALDATKFVAIQNATSGNFESFCVDGQFYSTKTGKPISIEEQKGAVRILSEIFGYTVNAAGYKELDPHVGLIYGDAININTMTRILSRLKENGFCSSNVVFGVGSFEFQFVTRDTLGIAMKATAGKVNGKHYNIAKNPKTDDGTKKSAKGYLIVYREDDGTLTLKDDLTREQYETLRGSERDAMRTVYLNGDVKILESIRTIRERAAQWI